MPKLFEIWSYCENNTKLYTENREVAKLLSIELKVPISGMYFLPNNRTAWDFVIPSNKLKYLEKAVREICQKQEK